MKSKRNNAALIFTLYLFGAVGCASSGPTPGTDGDANDARGDAVLPACAKDQDCPPGQLCELATQVCRPGCSTAHGCGQGRLCELDAGACVECFADSDCLLKQEPRCNASKHRCVPCLPAGDNCGPGEYCLFDGTNYRCEAGCKGDSDCGGNTPRCDLTAHQCVACLAHADCAAGTCCTASQECMATDFQSDARHCGACGVECLGGWLCCGGTCSNPANDLTNCGGCGNVCTAAHGAPKCAARVCGIEVCDSGWADCSGGISDGCETNTQINSNHCGGCNQTCPFPPNGTPRCAQGQCEIICQGGFADCDQDPTSGCEVNTMTSQANCDGCGNVCTAAHATARCSQATCQVAICDPGYADCNSNPADGCESMTESDTANCGGCNRVCSLPNAIAQCSSGACLPTSCLSGYDNCDNFAGNGCETSLTSDPAHCGACAAVCSDLNGTPSCRSGTCRITCALPFDNCDSDLANGCEANLDVDPNSCGGCGVVCSSLNVAVRTCSNGMCAGICVSGFQDCNGNKQVDGCEINLVTDAANCGGCGNRCDLPNATATCTQSACAIDSCQSGFGNCDGAPTNGCEANLQTDRGNCGVCNVICAMPNGTPRCVLGNCAIGPCNAGYADCDRNISNGCESNSQTDSNNCGACGTVCSGSGATCVAGLCTCSISMGGTLCGGTCVNTATDPNHCGGCGRSCMTRPCINSLCDGINCPAGWADCDQNNLCETNITTVQNCGRCGVVCLVPNGTPACVGGICQIASCTAPFADCVNGIADGCETNVSGSDLQNCGACQQTCVLAHATARCSQGACQVVACESSYGDCNSDPTDGCETNLLTDSAHCFNCGNKCPPDAPVCVNGNCRCNSDTDCALATGRPRCSTPLPPYLCVQCLDDAIDCPLYTACHKDGYRCEAVCGDGAHTLCNGGCCQQGVCTQGVANDACGNSGGSCSACSPFTPICLPTGTCSGCTTSADCKFGVPCINGLCTCLLDGNRCVTNSDCCSGNCDGTFCGVPNNCYEPGFGGHCGGGGDPPCCFGGECFLNACSFVDNGERCSADRQCSSKKCEAGVCVR